MPIFRPKVLFPVIAEEKYWLGDTSSFIKADFIPCSDISYPIYNTLWHVKFFCVDARHFLLLITLFHKCLRIVVFFSWFDRPVYFDQMVLISYKFRQEMNPFMVFMMDRK
jgi:hypothetical protein